MIWKYIADGMACFAAGVYLTRRYYQQTFADLKAAYALVVKGVSEEAKKF